MEVTAEAQAIAWHQHGELGARPPNYHVDLTIASLISTAFAASTEPSCDSAEGLCGDVTGGDVCRRYNGSR